MAYITKFKGLLAFFMLLNSFVFSADRFWVNGDGNWDDVSHWSATSGGAGGASVPTINDNVIFDTHSFTNVNDRVKIRGTAMCNNFTWYNTGMNPVLNGKARTDLLVAGSFIIEDTMENTFRGNILFLGAGQCSINTTIEFNSDIRFNSASLGSWNVTSNFSTSGSIAIERGTLNLLNVDVIADEFSTSGTYERALNLNGSKVTVNKWYFADNENLAFNSGTSKIIFLGDERDLLTGGLFYNLITNVNTRAFDFSYIIDTVPKPDASNCMGQVYIQVNGDGVPNYTYRILDGMGSNVESYGPTADVNWTSTKVLPQTGTSANYDLRVNDGVGAWQTKTISISIPTVTVAISVPKDVTCVYPGVPQPTSTNDANFTATPAGGVPNYSFLWSPSGETTQTTGNLGLNVHSCVVTDANGCKGTGVIRYHPFFPEYPGPAVLNISPNPAASVASCSDAPNGEITVAGTGGTVPYTFSVTPDGVVPSYVGGATFSGLAAGATYDVWIRDDNGCELQGIDVTVGTEPAPTADAGAASATICESENYTLSDANITNEASISWSTSGDGSFNDNTLEKPVYTPGVADIAGNSVTLTVTAFGNGNCADQTDNITLNINDLPTASAGGDNIICSTSNYSLGGAAASNYSSLAWTTSGTGTFSNASALNPTYTPSAADITAGLVTLTLTANGQGTCSNANSAMNLTIVSAPQVFAGGNDSSCEGTTHTISGATAVDQASLEWTTSGTGTFNNATLLLPTYTPSVADEGAGSVTLTLTGYANAPCADVQSSMILTLNSAPTANAGANGSICETETFTVSTASATNQTSVSWTTSGTGSFTGGSTLTPTYTPSAADITAGSVTLTLTASSAGCNNATSNITLTIKKSPTANAGSASSICEGQSLAISDASATFYNTITWSTSGTGSFNDVNRIDPTYTPSLADITAGSVTLTLTATGNATCLNAVSNKVVSINRLPVVEAGPNSNVCQGNSYSVAGASASNYDGLSWATSGTGTFVGGGTLTPTYTPSAADIVGGSVILTLNASGIGSCLDGSDFFTLNIIPAATANAGSNATICQTETYTLANATVTNQSNIIWSTSGDGGFDNINIQNPTYSPGAADITAGSVNLTVTAVGNAPCGNAVSAMTLTVNSLPYVEAGAPESVCEGVGLTFSDAVATSQDGISWTHNGSGTLAGSTTISPTYTPSAADAVAGTVTLTITASGLGTCADGVDTKILTINSNATAEAGSSPTICETDTYTVIDASVTNQSSITWSTSGDGGFNNTSILGTTYTPGAADRSAGSVTLTLTATGANGCANATDNMTITLTPIPVVSAGAGGNICNGDNITVSGASASNHAGLTWTSSGSGTFNDNSIIAPTYTPSAGDFTAGTVTLTLTAAGLATCADVPASAVYNFVDAPTANAGVSGTICEGSTFNLATASATNQASVLWTTSGNGTFTDATDVKPIYSPGTADIAAGSVTLTLTAYANAPCPNATSNVTINIEPAPVPNIGALNQACFGDDVPITNATVQNASSILWLTAGDGSFDDNTIINPVYTPGVADLANGSVQLTLRAFGNGPCFQVDDVATVNFSPEMVVSIGRPSPFLVSASTDISICMDVTHEKNQDVGFFLVAPDGVTTIELMTSPSEGGAPALPCNFGSDFENLCFTTASVGNLNLCAVPWATVSGDYAPVDPWNTIYGQDPAQGGWALEVRDCAPGDTGHIKNVTITFTDNDIISGNPTTISFSSGNVALPVSDPTGIGCAATTYRVPMGLRTSCNGLCDAHAIVSVIGGTGVYTSYNWDDPTVPDTDEVDLCAGSYTISVTDSDGCVATGTVEVTEPDPININIVGADILCKGESTGTATATASNGTAPYNYSWSNGETGANAVALPAGKSYVSVTDDNSCPAVDSITLTEPALDLTVTFAVTPTSCHNTFDGEIVATPSGGTLTSPDYTYTWSHGANTATVSGLMPGKYKVTITDDNGCTVVDSAEVTSPTELTVSITDTTHVLCYSDSTAIAVAAGAGGTPLYTYLWNDADNTADSTLADVPSGTYTVTVTDAEGCNATTTVNVTEPSEFSVSIGRPSPFIISASTQISVCVDVSHEKNQDVGFFLVAPDGVTTMELMTSPSEGGAPAFPCNFGSDFQDVCFNTTAVGNLDLCAIPWATVSGNYEPADPWSTIYGQDPAQGGWAFEVRDCAPGDTGHIKSVTITFTDNDIVSGNPTTISFSSGAITEQITDPTGLGCSATTYRVPMGLRTSCNGLCDAVAIASPLGGVEPYGAFTWSEPTLPNQAEVNLCAGTYSVSISDANGCIATTTVDVTEPAPINITKDSTLATCFNVADGSASITIANGTAPYNVLWSNGETTQAINSLARGQYNVTVTDAGDCEQYDSVLIDSPSELLAIANVDSTTCAQNNDGGIATETTGGVAPYSYLWGGGETDSVLINLAAATYALQITDFNGCTLDTTFAVFAPDTLVLSLNAVIDAGCAGEATGGATVSAIGGTRPFTYAWNNGATDSVISNVTAGLYKATVTDANGCIDSIDVIIGEPGAITATFTDTSHVACFYTTDGSAAITPIGGAGGYTFLWADGQTDSIAVNLRAGMKYVTVTDASGCTYNDSIVILSPDTIQTSITLNTPIDCYGNNSGAATASAIGGTGVLSYTWSNGETTASADSLTAGYNVVVVSDERGCFVNDSINLSEPSQLKIDEIGSTETYCIAAVGTAYAVASGGTGFIDYAWDNGVHNDTIYNLTTGIYSLTVTDDNGCTATRSVTVSDTSNIAVEITAPDTSVFCIGGLDGSAVATVTNGFGNITYSWSNGGNTDTITGLAAGDYTVTVTDENGCSASNMVTITEDNILRLSIIDSSHVSCFGLANGTATAEAMGGVGNYTYAWSNGDTGSFADSLNVGYSFVTVADENGCFALDSVLIQQPLQLQASIIDSTGVLCPGGNSGTATARVVDGTGTFPYSYSWSNGNSDTLATALSFGWAYVTISDANSCSIIDSVFIVDTMPEVQIVSFDTTFASCGIADASVQVNAIGGTGIFSYLWNNGGTSSQLNNIFAGVYSVTVTDENGCFADSIVTITDTSSLVIDGLSVTNVTCGICTGSMEVTSVANGSIASYLWSNGETTAIASGLCADSVYAVTVTDTDGCTASSYDTVRQGNGLTGSFADTILISCAGMTDGGVTYVASGGLPSYTYLWSTGHSTASVSGLGAGKYYVTVSDGNCSYTDSIVFTDPSILSLNIDATPTSCFGLPDGSAIAHSANAISIDAFSWSNGDTDSIASNLSSGWHFVTATYYGTCTIVDSTEITEPSPITYAIIANNATCGNNDGLLIVEALGGSGTLSFEWEIIGDSDSTLAGNTNDTLSNIGINAYRVTITDTAGCANISSPILLNNQGGITLTEDSIAHISCVGINSGAVRIAANGGTNPYTFEWTNLRDDSSLTDTVNTDSTSLAQNLEAGLYKLMVTDGSVCQAVSLIEIETRDALTASITDSSMVSCFGLADGFATVTAGMGAGGYSYSWSNGDTLSTNDSLIAGTYYVTVSDIAGCSISDSITITEPLELAGSISGYSDVRCASACDGSATFEVTVGTGTAPYEFAWSNGEALGSIASLCGGDYYVTVTDANGCSITDSISIADTLAPLIITSIDTTTAYCAMANAKAVANVAGGAGSYTYAWSNGGTADSIVNIPVGVYFLQVTDANGCTATEYVTIDDTSSLAFERILVTDISCADCSGSIEIDSVSGGVPNYSYAWSNGDTDALAENLCADLYYTVTVSDAAGCARAYVNTVDDNNQLSVVLAIDSVISCSGMANAVASATVTGGNGMYSYAWSNGGATATANNLDSGWVSVTIDDGACSVIDSIYISPAQDIQLNMIASDIGCGGTSTGSAEVVVLNGIVPDAYIWSNGEFTSSISNVPADEYFVTVTYNTYCVAVDSITIAEPAPIVFTTEVIPASCGLDNGIIHASATGGTGTLNFAWTIYGNEDSALINANNDTLENVGVDVYQLTITDATGCSVQTAPITMRDSGDVVITKIITSSITCIGRNDGTAVVEPSSASAPFSYEWWSFNDTAYITSDTTITATQGIVDSLMSGTYKVFVENALGCATVEVFDITEEDVLAVNFTSITDPTCFGGTNGSITATGINGIPYTVTDAYRYNWTGGVTDTPAIIDLAAGTYYVTVTDSSMCSVVDSATLISPTQLQSGIADTLQTICYADALDSVTISAMGGTGPYSYMWDDTQVGSTIYDVAIGEHIVTITDANGCPSITDTLVVSRGGEFYVTFDTVNTACGDSIGIAVVTAVGGSAPYSYLWSHGETTDTASNLWVDYFGVTVTDVAGCMVMDTVKIEDTSSVAFKVTILDQIKCAGLPIGSAQISDTTGGSGNYSFLWENGDERILADSLREGFVEVRVFDDMQCTGLERIFMGSDSVLSIDNFGLTNDISCGGNSNGSARVYLSGGDPEYSYLWSTSVNDTLDRINNLGAGMYTVTATDANGCEVTDSVEVMEAPLDIRVVSLTNVECYGYNSGRIEVRAIGGFGSPRTYLWSTGSDSTVIDSLIAGEYIVTVTELGNQCQATDTITISEPSDFTRSFITLNPTNCGDSTGIVRLDITGGTAPFTYIWSNGDADSVLNNAWADYFQVTVSDANGCAITDTFRVPDNSPFYVEKGNVGLIKCHGMYGSMSVRPYEGIRPYSYEWSHDASATADSSVFGLTEGYYSVTVTDSTGCWREMNLGFLDEPELISVAFEHDSIIECYGDSMQVIAHVSGGAGGYEYAWYEGSVLLSNTDSILEKAAGGLHKLYITDIEDCPADTAYVDVLESVAIDVEFTLDNTGCGSQLNTGSIRIDTIKGSNPPFDFVWEDGSSDVFRDNLYGLIYILTITDSKGCTQDLVPDISAVYPGGVTMENTVLANCNFNSPTGALQVDQVMFGEGPYTYVWNDPAQQTTATATNLEAGVYRVTITGSNECAKSFFDTVHYATFVNSYAESIDHKVGIDTICFGDSIQLNAGGLPVSDLVTYNWFMDAGYDLGTISDNAVKSPKVRPDSISTYYVIRTFEGCSSDTASITLMFREPVGLDVNLYIEDINEDPDSTEVLQGVEVELVPNDPWFIDKITVLDGFISYEYQSLTTGFQPDGYIDTVTNETSYLNSGKYSVYVTPERTSYFSIMGTTKYGCKEYDTVRISIADQLIIPTGFSPNGDGVNDVWNIPYTKLTPNAYVVVYNRWGVKVFEKDKNYFNNPWDGMNKAGKELPLGTYYYYIEFNDSEGTAPRSGPVTILR